MLRHSDRSISPPRGTPRANASNTAWRSSIWSLCPRYGRRSYKGLSPWSFRGRTLSTQSIRPSPHRCLGVGGSGGGGVPISIVGISRSRERGWKRDGFGKWGGFVLQVMSEIGNGRLLKRPLTLVDRRILSKLHMTCDGSRAIAQTTPEYLKGPAICVDFTRGIARRPKAGWV
jgi:hypothetical protein